MKRSMKLCVAGGGKMAEALVGGLLATGWAQPDEIGVIEVIPERRSYLAEMFPGVHLAESCQGACASAVFDVSDVLIAVKPQHVAQVASELGAGGATRALSIAAGVRIDALLDGFGSDARVIRAMPNTPALVGQGAAAIAGSATADEADLGWAIQILSAVGMVTVVDEGELDAVTGLSGSGPAYVFLLAEAMIAAGIEQGLSPHVADALGRQTVLGAATLLAESSESPAQLRANVTSPGGTTAAAIAAMQGSELEKIVAQGIAAAVARSVELGG
ncbi:MAG: pyrroline-5-carboxylate reductase [Acidimicrobiales bacterium]|jgi:pyrroline-5-carboxylate reductase